MIKYVINILDRVIRYTLSNLDGIKRYRKNDLIRKPGKKTRVHRERAFARLDYAFYFHQAVFAYGRPPLGARHVVNISCSVGEREGEGRAGEARASFRRNEAKRAAAWLTVTHAARGPVRSLCPTSPKIFSRASVTH